MNTLELFSFLKYESHCKKYFLGVYARNELPKSFNKLPSALIFNTDNRNEPGEHWLAIFIDEYRNVEFFDPAGMHPSFYGLESYISSIGNSMNWNSKRIQSEFSEICGQICIFYLYFKCRQYTLDYIQHNFSSDLINNEKIILNFLDQIFI